MSSLSAQKQREKLSAIIMDAVGYRLIYIYFQVMQILYLHKYTDFSRQNIYCNFLLNFLDEVVLQENMRLDALYNDSFGSVFSVLSFYFNISAVLSMNFPLCLLLSRNLFSFFTCQNSPPSKKDIRLKIPKRYCTSKVNLVLWNS